MRNPIIAALDVPGTTWHHHRSEFRVYAVRAKINVDRLKAELQTIRALRQATPMILREFHAICVKFTRADLLPVPDLLICWKIRDTHRWHILCR
jgi:hypothetical protein